MIEVTGPVLAAQPFLRGMREEQLAALAATASDVVFPARHSIFEDGGYAANFWLVRSGYALLDAPVPEDLPVVVDSIGIGELLGWSWLLPPYRWEFGAVCVTEVETIQFEAAAVRSACAADPALGYELTQRVLRVLARRLRGVRTLLIARPADAAGSY
jgi:CRP/FNR family cyclic AMP-dependent transcriptional regulator